jgi:hypothetical protein
MVQDNAQGTSDGDPEPREVKTKPNLTCSSHEMRELLRLAIEAQIQELKLIKVLHSLRLRRKKK